MSWSLCIVLTVLILSVTGTVRDWIKYLQARDEAAIDRIAAELPDEPPLPPGPVPGKLYGPGTEFGPLSQN